MDHLEAFQHQPANSEELLFFTVSSEKVEKNQFFFVSFKVTMLNKNRWFKSEKTENVMAERESVTFPLLHLLFRFNAHLVRSKDLNNMESNKFSA